MTSKIGRNAPCPCGSGQKYKHCHGRLTTAAGAAASSKGTDIQHLIDRQKAAERIRQTQQGLGQPIVGFRADGHQMVGVRNRLYWSDKWKTFADFLGDYIKDVIGSDWGNLEIAKPLSDRHPIMQWYDRYCRYQQQVITMPGEVHRWGNGRRLGQQAARSLRRYGWRARFAAC